jgi:hypothetical protein
MCRRGNAAPSPQRRSASRRGQNHADRQRRPALRFDLVHLVLPPGRVGRGSRFRFASTREPEGAVLAQRILVCSFRCEIGVKNSDFENPGLEEKPGNHLSSLESSSGFGSGGGFDSHTLPPTWLLARKISADAKPSNPLDNRPPSTRKEPSMRRCPTVVFSVGLSFFVSAALGERPL